MSLPKRQFFPYAIIVLLGYIGFSLPLPILPEMFLDSERSILGPSYTIGQKTLLLGLLMTSYPLGQLFGCPLLGQLSDRHGRKKIILFSLIGTTIGYLITAWATSLHAIGGIFLGLLLCGFCEGNISIAQSVIADLTPSQDKSSRATHFGWINLFVTLGFIIGPLIGGQLADPDLVSWFTFATPFWMAAILTLCGIAVILFCSKETRVKASTEKKAFFRSAFNVFKMPKLRRVYCANFFLALGFFSFFRFFPVYLERTFNFSSSQLAYVIAYDSVAFAIALLFFIKPLARYFSSHKITAAFACLLAVFFAISLLPQSPYAVLWTVPPIGICLAVVITYGSVMVSTEAESDFQGLAMGNLQSIQVLAEVITGVMGGVLAAQASFLPLLIGAVMAVICSLILISGRKYSLVNKEF